MSRRAVAIFLGGALLGACVEGVAASERVRAMFAGANASHCGCMNKASCTEPCSSCCGPNGYADCFANPSPGKKP